MVAWAQVKLRDMPEVGSLQGTGDTDALIAIGKFLDVYVTDITGALHWPWASEPIYTYPTQPEATIAQCLDKRAQQIAAQYDHIIVQCAGDLVSSAIVASLLKTGIDIEVRYTPVFETERPGLFTKTLPGLGVTVNNRGTQALIAGCGPHIDGRAADFLVDVASISDLREWHDLIYGDDIGAMVAAICQQVRHDDRAFEGITRFIKACPVNINTPLMLRTALVRYCDTQSAVMVGGMIDPDPQTTINNRVPFYDDPLFTAVMPDVARKGSLQAELIDYTETVMGAKHWSINDSMADHEPPRVALHWVPGCKIYNYWMDDHFRPRHYSEFPWA